MACVGAEYEGIEGEVEEDIGTAEQALTCVTPPAVTVSGALDTSGDVGNATEFTSPSASYYPGYYVSEITGTTMPFEIAYAQNVDITGTCSSNKVQAEFYCFTRAYNCWYVCGASTTKSGVLVPSPFGGASSCDASLGISVPSGVSAVRIKARAWYSGLYSLVGKRVLEGVSWHW
jgi:hypothetical protein